MADVIALTIVSLFAIGVVYIMTWAIKKLDRIANKMKEK